MAKIQIKKEHLLWVVGILFVMSILPGEGTKAVDQQAIVESEYYCTSVDDCPTCVGGGLIEFNESAAESGFFEELSFSECDLTTNRCQLSDSCLIWDCPAGAQRVNATGGLVDCESVKKTILDNTIGKLNENPMMLLIIIGLIVAYFMIK